jgi:hypothetical protein
MATKSSISIITEPFRLAFPSVFKPAVNKLNPNAAPRYEITMLFPKSVNIKALNDIAVEAIKLKWGNDPAQWPKDLRSPFRDGDTKADREGYAGHTFVKASTTLAFGIVDQNRQPIISQEKLYAGCWCRASVHAWAYDTTGNRGVSFGLDALQLVKDDTRFARGGADAQKVFTVLPGGAASKDDPNAYQQPNAAGSGSPFAN